MNQFETRIRQLLTPFTRWWENSHTKKAWQRRSEGKDALRREAATLSKQARSALHDLRESDAGKRAATTLHDLRDSDAGKRAATALTDLRDSDAGKRAEKAWQDLRQREPVRKAEASARRALHDLRSGSGDDGASPSGTTTA